MPAILVAIEVIGSFWCGRSPDARVDKGRVLGDGVGRVSFCPIGGRLVLIPARAAKHGRAHGAGRRLRIRKPVGAKVPIVDQHGQTRRRDRHQTEVEAVIESGKFYDRGMTDTASDLRSDRG